MTTIAIRGSGDQIIECRFDSFDSKAAYRCDVVLAPEDGGGYSVECTNLVGVISEGATEQEALANVADAFRETVLYYQNAGLPIPFGKVDVESSSGCREKTLVVSV